MCQTTLILESYAKKTQWGIKGQVVNWAVLFEKQPRMPKKFGTKEYLTALIHLCVHPNYCWLGVREGLQTKPEVLTIPDH